MVFSPREIGFCFGVKRAVSICETVLAEHGACVSLGPVIHNEKVIGRLSRAGLEVDPDPGSGPEPVVIRSHGLHPLVREKLERRGRLVIDATCPFVRSVQERVSLLRDEGYFIVIVGKPDHPEVEALLGFAGERAMVYPVGGRDRAPGCARARSLLKKQSGTLAVVSQTTNTENIYLRARLEILSLARCHEIRMFDTVCRVTERRQAAACKLAGRVDVMLVAGSRASANTGNLYQLLLSRKPETHLVSGADDIKREWCTPDISVGLVSGTSTPAETIREIKKKLKGRDPDAAEFR